MDINERFKELRKALGLSQEELGNKIGLSKSGISNIESGTRNVTDKHIKLICSEFPINEDWLRTGTGEMFLKTSSDTMEQLKKEFDLDEFSFKLVHGYLKLAPAERKAIRDLFYRVIESEENIFNAGETIQTTEHNSNQKTTEELEEEYKKSRLQFAQNKELSASNTIADTEHGNINGNNRASNQ